MSFSIRIFDAFGRLLGASLPATRRPIHVQDASKTCQDGARSRPGGNKNQGKLGLGSQDGSETELGSIWGGFSDDFRLNFEWVYRWRSKQSDHQTH